MNLKSAKLIKRSKLLIDEDGTVESTLVIIPIVLLFLSVLQIATSVMGRGIALNTVQGDISREALLGSNFLSPSSDLLGTAMTRIPIPGGGSVIVGKKVSITPKISPLIVARDSFISTGIAVDENW